MKIKHSFILLVLFFSIIKANAKTDTLINPTLKSFKLNQARVATSCYNVVNLSTTQESSVNTLNLSSYFKTYDYSKFIANYGFGAPVWKGDGNTPVEPLKAGWSVCDMGSQYPLNQIPEVNSGVFEGFNYTLGGNLGSAGNTALNNGFPNAINVINATSASLGNINQDYATLNAIAEYFKSSIVTIDVGVTARNPQPSYRSAGYLMLDSEGQGGVRDIIFDMNFLTEVSKKAPDKKILLYGTSPSQFSTWDYIYGYYSSLSEQDINVLKRPSSPGSGSSSSIFWNEHLKTGKLYFDGQPGYVKSPLPTTATLYQKDNLGNYILNNGKRILRTDEFSEFQFGMKNTWLPIAHPSTDGYSDNVLRNISDVKWAIGTPYRFMTFWEFCQTNNASFNSPDGLNVDITRWRDYPNKFISVNSLLTEHYTLGGNSIYTRWLGEEQIKFNVMAPLMLGYAGVELWENGWLSDQFYNPDFNNPIPWHGRPLPSKGGKLYAQWTREGGGTDVNTTADDNWTRYKWATAAVSTMRDVMNYYTLDTTLRYFNFTRYGTAVGDKEIIILGMYQNSNLHLMAYYPYHDPQDNTNVDFYINNNKHTFTVEGRKVLLLHFNGLTTTNLSPNDLIVSYQNIDGVSKILRGNLENHTASSVPSNPNSCQTDPCAFSVAATSSIPTPNTGQSIELTAVCTGTNCTGVSYSWSGNGISGTSSLITINAPTAAGSYTYTITASKTGCANKTAAVTINVINTTCNFTVAATNSNATPNPGQSFQLSSSCTGTNCSGVSYSWSGNGISGTSSSITINAPATAGSYTYTITASKSGCANKTATTTINVFVNNCLNLTNVIVPANCTIEGNTKKQIKFDISGGSGTYQIAINSGSYSNIGPSYELWWLPAWGNPVLSVRDANNNSLARTITVTSNACGVAGSYSLNTCGPCSVNPPSTINATVNPVVSGQPTTLSTSCQSGATVKWSTGATGNSITVSPTITTTYSAYCDNGSCSSTSVSKTISVPINCLNLTNVIVPANCTIEGNTKKQIKFDISGGSGTYQVAINSGAYSNIGASYELWWLPAWGNPVLSVRDANNNALARTITVTSNACGVAGSYSMNTCDPCSVNPPSTINATVNPVVLGQATTLSTSCQSGATVKWSTGATGNSISVSPTSTTTYSAYCENGSCTSTIVSMPITVIPPPNCLNLTNVIVPTNCTVEGNTKKQIKFDISGGSGTYEVAINGGTFSNTGASSEFWWLPEWGNPVFTVRDASNNSKTRSLTVTSNACGVAGSYTINTCGNGARISMEEPINNLSRDNDKEKSIVIFPNPVSENTFSIKADFRIKDVIILNSQNQIVRKNIKNLENIDVTNLISGVYNICFFNEEGEVIFRKIVISR
ncbi:MAG: hypothetical protein IPP61_06680 [Cytophagaceae bacterium]|nr:hypothetical protein [Cytophagaceae bacterium]